MAKVEKNTLFGRALVRIRAKIEENTPFLVGLLLRLGKKIANNALFGKALVRVMAKIEKITHFRSDFVKLSAK